MAHAYIERDVEPRGNVSYNNTGCCLKLQIPTAPGCLGSMVSGGLTSAIRELHVKKLIGRCADCCTGARVGATAGRSADPAVSVEDNPCSQETIGAVSVVILVDQSQLLLEEVGPESLALSVAPLGWAVNEEPISGRGPAGAD